jgi:peptide/nickel transport system substrate-binding protein
MKKRILLAQLCTVAFVAAASGPALSDRASDTVVWSTSNEINSADIYYENMREVVIATHSACDTLMHRDPLSGEYLPLLAESYEWVDDTTLEFRLRQGVKFHDGSDFTAADVAYTFEHASNPDHGVVTQLVVSWIDSMEVVDDYTVRIHAASPTPAAINYLSGVTPIYPEGHYDNAPEVPGADGTTRRDWGAITPVCTGPYRITEFNPGSDLVMERNDDYFEGGPKGQPEIGRLVFRTISDTETQIAELVTGGVDWLWGIPPENAQMLAGMGNVTVQSAPTTRISFLSLDAAGRSGDTPMTDARVRRAIAHAVDAEALATSLVGDGSEPLVSMCYPDQFGCSTDVPIYEYDPDRARELLAEAGYENGFTVTMYAYRDRPFTEAVMGYLSEVGIETDLTYLQWPALRPLLQDGRVELAHLSWGSQGILDASASVSHYFKHGQDDYALDDTVKDLLEQADSVTDDAQRQKLYHDALTIIAEEAYFVPLFSYGRTYAFNAELDIPVTPDELAHFYLARWK